MLLYQIKCVITLKVDSKSLKIIYSFYCIQIKACSKEVFSLLIYIRPNFYLISILVGQQSISISWNRRSLDEGNRKQLDRYSFRIPSGVDQLYYCNSVQLFSFFF